jgi:hypothetical protein
VSDQRIRSLERDAKRGEPGAREALERARQRRAPVIAVGTAMGITPDGDVGPMVDGMEFIGIAVETPSPGGSVHVHTQGAAVVEFFA